MLTRLDQLFGTDSNARWRIILSSSLIVAVWGIVSEFSGKPVRSTQIEATIIGALVFLAQVLLYCIRVNPGRTSRPVVLGPGTHFPRRLAFSAIMLVFVGTVPVPLLDAAILRRRIRVLSRTQFSPDTMAIIGDLINIARAQKVTIDPELVSHVGEKLVTIASTQKPEAPIALGTVLSLGAYVSSRAADSAPETPDLSPADQETLTSIAGAGPPFGLRVSRFGSVPISEAARYEPIDKDINAGNERGSAYLIVEHEPPTMSLRVDGMHIKNTIFRYATIEYLGGPVILENVFFINCEFKIPLTAGGIELASSILASPVTAFRFGI